MLKRVAAIHDISCFGKCSLTVALPLLSAAGIETAIIPTAVLSTHTGGFSGYTFRDLTDDILPVAAHWKKEGIEVDAVYTGYLASKEQVDIVIQAIELIRKKDGFIMVDPAMGDDGRLYSGLKDDLPQEMLKLCATADIITPNITEASLMLGTPYQKGPYNKEYIEELLRGLSALTKNTVVLSGVYFDDEKIGAACCKDGEIFYAFSKRAGGFSHGTGDVFASTLLAAVMNGQNTQKAVQTAVDFTCECIECTHLEHPEMVYGVAFEQKIPELLKYLEL